MPYNYRIARKALEKYTQMTGTKNSDEQNITDLIADLLILANRSGQDATQVLHNAESYYQSDLEEAKKA